MDKNLNSRRGFIKQAMLASAVAAVAPGLLSARPKLAAANERVNLACIGIGNRGGEIIRDLYATGLANIVALCDVDMGAPHTLKIIEQFPDVPRFQDFRQMFDKMGNQIDAVTVGVPDFTHFPITMHAMGLGK